MSTTDTKQEFSHSCFIALTVIILTAMGLRLYGINFGLPELLHLDEPFEMHRALRLAAGAFDFDRAGKGGFYYLAFAELATAFVFLFLTGRITSPGDFAYFYVQHEADFYLGARIISAIVGIASIYLLYVIVSRIWNKKAGLIAALLLAVSGIHVTSSHYASVDVTLVFFLLLTWLFIINSTKSPSIRNFFLTGLFAGLALITKLSAAVIILPMTAAIIIISLQKKITIKDGVALGGVMLSTFVFTSLICEPGYLQEIINLKEMIIRIFGTPSAIAGHKTAINHNENLYLYYGNILIQAAGVPLLAVFFISLIISAITIPAISFILISFLVPYFLIISNTTTDLYYARYLLPITPLIFCISAIGLVHTGELIRKRSVASYGIFLGLILISLLWTPVSYSLSEINRMGNPYTQISAKNWIEENIPPHSSIHMEGNVEHRSQYDVPLLNTDENMKKVAEEVRKRAPGKAKYIELRRKYVNTLSRPRYDLSFTRRHEKYPSLNELKESGVDFIVINKNRISGKKTSKISRKDRRSRIDFYQELKTAGEAHKIAEFLRDRNHNGYNLAIYKL